MVRLKLFSSENNTENHLALVQFKSWWWWCMCLALRSGAIAGGLAFNPRLCKGIGMVWHDTQVPLTSLSFVWSWLVSLIQFHRAGFTMRRSSLWLVHLECPLLGRSLTLQVSWYLCCNLLMISCDTQNWFVTSDNVLPVYSLAIAKWNWSIFKRHIWHIIPKIVKGMLWTILYKHILHKTYHQIKY